LNAKPHMHEVEIRNYCDGNSQRISYGDTRVIVHAWFFGKLPSPRRIERAVKKAIKRHDKGSMKHAQYQASLEKVNQHLEKKPMVIGYHQDRYGKDDLNRPMYSSTYHNTTSPEAWGTDLVLKAMSKKEVSELPNLG
jgi:hypothetical protein